MGHQHNEELKNIFQPTPKGATMPAKKLQTCPHIGEPMQRIETSTTPVYLREMGDILSAEAFLSWGLFVECPYCEEDIDLADSPHDDEGEYFEPIFNNRWDEIANKKVDCPNCKKTFSVSSVKY